MAMTGKPSEFCLSEEEAGESLLQTRKGESPGATSEEKRVIL
jgi:hypothetical protein